MPQKPLPPFKITTPFSLSNTDTTTQLYEIHSFPKLNELYEHLFIPSSSSSTSSSPSSTEDEQRRIINTENNSVLKTLITYLLNHKVFCLLKRTVFKADQKYIILVPLSHDSLGLSESCNTVILTNSNDDDIPSSQSSSTTITRILAPFVKPDITQIKPQTSKALQIYIKDNISLKCHDVHNCDASIADWDLWVWSVHVITSCDSGGGSGNDEYEMYLSVVTQVLVRVYCVFLYGVYLPPIESSGVNGKKKKKKAKTEGVSHTILKEKSMSFLLESLIYKVPFLLTCLDDGFIAASSSSTKDEKEKNDKDKKDGEKKVEKVNEKYNNNAFPSFLYHVLYQTFITSTVSFEYYDEGMVFMEWIYNEIEIEIPSVDAVEEVEDVEKMKQEESRPVRNEEVNKDAPKPKQKDEELDLTVEPQPNHHQFHITSDSTIAPTKVRKRVHHPETQKQPIRKPNSILSAGSSSSQKKRVAGGMNQMSLKGNLNQYGKIKVFVPEKVVKVAKVAPVGVDKVKGSSEVISGSVEDVQSQVKVKPINGGSGVLGMNSASLVNDRRLKDMGIIKTSSYTNSSLISTSNSSSLNHHSNNRVNFSKQDHYFTTARDSPGKSPGVVIGETPVKKSFTKREGGGGGGGGGGKRGRLDFIDEK